MKRTSVSGRLGWACVAVTLLWGCQRKEASPPVRAPIQDEVKAPSRPAPPKKVTVPAACPGEIKECSFRLKISGEFSDKPSWDVNLINASILSHQNKPPALKVDVGVLAALNEKRSSIVGKVMGRRKMLILAGEPVIKPLTGPVGDRHFSLDVVIGPDNGMGGHASGLTFDVRLISRHRDPGKYRAVARRTIKARAVGAAGRELERELDTALTEVFAGFKKTLVASMEQQREPQPFFVLAVKLDNLDKKQQAHVRDAVLPCLFKQGWTTTVKARKSPRGMLRYAVHYPVTDDRSAKKIVEGIASSFAITAHSHGKSRCSLWRSPLHGYETRAEAKPAGKQITLSWQRPGKKRP